MTILGNILPLLYVLGTLAHTYEIQLIDSLTFSHVGHLHNSSHAFVACTARRVKPGPDFWVRFQIEFKLGSTWDQVGPRVMVCSDPDLLSFGICRIHVDPFCKNSFEF